jgi:hypothetical protein
MNTYRTIKPHHLPDPFLIDSEFLLRELARIRGLALNTPLHIDCILPTNTVVDALWRLEQQLRYLLKLHREGQRVFAQKAAAAQEAAPATRSKVKGKLRAVS